MVKRKMRTNLHIQVLLGILQLSHAQLFLIESYPNATVSRLKRQLFRDDIPHNRPLTGNSYASQHGFPHPGRWADGTSSPYKPSARLPTPHQHYIDMLDGARHGRQHGFRTSEISFANNNNNVLQNHNSGFSGGSDFSVPSGFGNDNDAFHQHQDYQDEGKLNFDFGRIPSKPDSDNIEILEEEPLRPSYGPPIAKPHYPGEPQPIVHIHPVQYSPVITIPEPPKRPSPAPPVQSYRAPHHQHQHQQLNPPQHGSDFSYGPPNHISGPLIGGFVPSKGIGYANHNHHNYQHQVHEEEYHVPSKPLKRPPTPYRFQPFKSHFAPQGHGGVEAEGPVAIPILAQFHTPSRPYKGSRLKEPVHVIYKFPSHQGGGGGYHGRRPHSHFQGYVRRPKLPPPPPPLTHHHEWFSY